MVEAALKSGSLSTARFAAFLTPYREIFPVRWTGTYVIVEPIVARTAAAAAATPTPAPSRPPDPPGPVWPVVPAAARALPD